MINNTSRWVVVSAVFGVTLAWTWLASLLGLQDRWSFWGIGALLLSVLALWAARWTAFRTVAVGMALLGGTALAVIVEALVAESFLGVSRNLFPLGIALWWGLACAPALIVFVIARAG